MEELHAAAPSESLARGGSSTLLALLESLRFREWIKNGFVFAALIFSRSLLVWDRTLRVTLAALLFSLLASAVYLLNDALDAPEDRQHPAKRQRPIASGRLNPQIALVAAAALALTAAIGAWWLDFRFFVVLVSYGAITVLYSLFLKRLMLVDVFAVAAGFVLRVVGGGVVIRVEVSPWLIVCTMLLALFLALTKRRHELVLLGEDASSHRSSLAHYSPYFLDQLIGIVTASTLMSYALYTLSEDATRKFPGRRLELTIPFVLFGIFRYLYLVHRNSEGGNPARLLLGDRVLLCVVVLWVAAAVVIIYT